MFHPENNNFSFNFLFDISEGVNYWVNYFWLGKWGLVLVIILLFAA